MRFNIANIQAATSHRACSRQAGNAIHFSEAIRAGRASENLRIYLVNTTIHMAERFAAQNKHGFRRIIKSSCFQAGISGAFGVSALSCDIMEIAMQVGTTLTSTALVIAACLSPMLAQAQISKCIDTSGRVIYSDAPCAGAETVAFIEVDEPAGVAPQGVAIEATPTARVPSPATVQATPLRESAWAHLGSRPVHVSPDSTSVRDARAALASMDQAMASLRTQRLAANN